MENKNSANQLSNEQIYLFTVKKNGPITKREIQRKSGFSWGLTSKTVNELVQKGYVSCFNKGGRNAEEFDINHSDFYFVGISFNQKELIAVVTDMKGRVVEQYDAELENLEYGYVIEQFYGILDSFFEKYKDQHISGIGFALQGVVNSYEGVSNYIAAITGWKDVPLKKMMEERYHVEVSVEHSPDCFMKVEYEKGCISGTQAQNVLFVRISHDVGIGMSIMLNGEIYRGTNSKAGEIGVIPVARKEDGSPKFLEHCVIKKDIVKQYQRMTKQPEPISYEALVQLIHNGDKKGKKIIKQLGSYIGTAISTANIFFNPEIIIINAAGSEFQSLLFDTICSVVEENTYDKALKIRLSEQGMEAAAVGAALIAVDKAILKIV